MNAARQVVEAFCGCARLLVPRGAALRLLVGLLALAFVLSFVLKAMLALMAPAAFAQADPCLSPDPAEVERCLRQSLPPEATSAGPTPGTGSSGAAPADEPSLRDALTDPAGTVRDAVTDAVGDVVGDASDRALNRLAAAIAEGAVAALG